MAMHGVRKCSFAQLPPSKSIDKIYIIYLKPKIQNRSLPPAYAYMHLAYILSISSQQS
jgi:hypothetical protein